MATTLKSFCKINLGLAIGPARADGFHSLTTCYQTLAAYDLVTVEASPAGRTALEITCTDPRVPCDATNTAWKMVDLALRSLNVTAQVAIHIDKRLPVQGGLGAGSANAIAALLALEAELARHSVAPGFGPLWGPERLRIAALVGSDVPLFLIGGAVLGVGRGEEVYPLPDVPPTACVLALPEIGVSTPQAFRDWDALQSSDLRAESSSGIQRSPSRDPEWTGRGGSGKLVPLSRALASAFVPGPAAHSSGVSASGGDQLENSLLALVRTGMENDFEEVVFRQYPSLGTIRRTLAGSGKPGEEAICAALSGSGSALFGLYGTPEAAAAAGARLAQSGIRSLRTQTLPRDEYWRQLGDKKQVRKAVGQ
jgi:4-diphosphocytidyl-2-C-methyl-D-erythritol kinase